MSIVAHHCLIKSAKEHFFRIDVNSETQECLFDLVPLQPGPIKLTITARQELPNKPELIRQTSLELTAILQVSELLPEDTLTEESIRDDVQAKLSQFDIGNLRSICLKLRIDWDNLEGSTKAEKVDALILYCERRGLTVTLVDAIHDFNT